MGAALAFHPVPAQAQATPAATITANFTCGTAPLNVCFSATATGLDPKAIPWTYDWNFGDGTYPTPNFQDPLPCHAFMIPNGQFTVAVIITDTNATQAPGTLLISTIPLVVSACVDQTNGPAPLLVQWNNACGIISGGIPPYSIVTDFGDGSALCYDWKTQHAFINPGTYYVSTTVTDSCIPPTVVSDTHIIITVTQLTVSGTATADRLCGPSGTQVCFAGAATGGMAPYVYSWNFGDGSPVVGGQAPCHTFSSPGIYTVTMAVQDAAHNLSIDNHIQVVITPALAVSAGVSRSNGYAPFTVYFTSTVTGGTGPYNYSWDFGDGSPVSTLGAPSHQYLTSGTYKVALTVTDSCVPSATATDKSITLAVYPIVVTATPNFTCGYAPLNVIFTGAAVGGAPPYTYSWDFGDATPGSALENPSHSYLSTGNFTATLTVTDSLGNSGVGTTAVSVTPALSATAIASATQGAAPLTVDFSSSVSGGTPPYTYDWDFGDGSQHSQSPADQHTLIAPGTYAVTLTVRDNCEHAIVKTIEINAYGSLTATPSVNETCGYVPLNVIFAAGAVGGVPPYAYSWDFGDGTPGSTLATPSHTYSSLGGYTATLTVTDSLSHTASGTVVVSVTSEMSVTPIASVTQGPAPLKVDFSSTVSGGTPPYSYDWDFGDGSPHSLTSVCQHTLVATGVYTVTLKVTDSCSHIVSRTLTVTAFGAVSPAISTDVSCGYAPLNVAFTGSTSGGVPPYTFAWTFGDGGTSTLMNPSHSYLAVNNYTVTLTVTDSLSNTGSTTATISVTDVLAATIQGAPATTGPAPLTVNLTSSVSGGLPAAPPNPLYGYSWSFGDGSTVVLSRDAQHTWSTPGTYDVTFTVTDSCSHSAVKHLQVIAYGAVQPTPAADFTCGYAPLNVIFTGGATGGLPPYTAYSWNFGDGSPANTQQNPSHAFASVGTYTVALTVTDSLGHTGTTNLTVSVTPLLAATASASVTQGAPPLVVNFTGGASGGSAPYTFSWDFGDGSAPSTAANPQHAYGTAGVYTATLTVTDSCGHSADKAVTINAFAPVAATPAVNLPCGYAPLNVIFTGGATGGVPPYTAWSWNFGDGTPGDTLQNPSHTYMAVGTYTAVLTATDSLGHTGTGTVTVTVTPQLGATATVSATQGPAPLRVNFSSSVSGGTPPYTYDWNFDDGSQHSQSPADQHTMVAPGTYNVTLTVNDSCNHSVVKTVTINAYGPVVATPTVNFTCGTAPLNVIFDGAGSGGVPPYTYRWNFGDGSPLNSQQNPSHTYSSVGSYTATLTVTDSLSNTGSATLTIGVTQPLAVSASADVTQGKAPLKVNLTGAISGGTPPYTMDWDYGDGSPHGQSSPDQHTFVAPGTYTVTLTVQDSCSHTSAATVTINALAPVVPTLAASTACGTATLNVCFTASAAGGLPPYTFSWSFGDGSPASGDDKPCHNYLTPGTYNVVLTATDSLGTVGTSAPTPIQVLAPTALAVTAFASSTSGLAPLTVNFTKTISGGVGPFGYDWDFGDGTNHDTGSAPTHIYLSPGTFTVTLTVTMQDACGVSYTKSDSHLVIQVNAAPTIELLSPVNGQQVGASVTFQSRVFDNVAVTRVDYYVNGLNVGSATSAPYTFVWDCTGSNGTYTASASVLDSLGRTATSASVTIYINNPSLDGRFDAGGTPFKLKVFGRGFMPGAVITINGQPAPSTLVKSSTLVVATGGTLLKSMLPKGVPVMIAVVNPDGSATGSLPFIR